MESRPGISFGKFLCRIGGSVLSLFWMWLCVHFMRAAWIKHTAPSWTGWAAIGGLVIYIGFAVWRFNQSEKRFAEYQRLKAQADAAELRA